jgi:hypothetical protein
MSDEDRRRAERRKILKRLNSYEGDGLSDDEAQRLAQRERVNEYERRFELAKGWRTAGS